MVQSFLNKESFNRLGNLEWTNDDDDTIILTDNGSYITSSDIYPKFFIESSWAANSYEEISWDIAEKLLVKERTIIQKKLDDINCSITMLKRAKGEVVKEIK